MPVPRRAMRPRFGAALGIAATLAAGTAGGAAFALLGVPLPWLLGPFVVAAVGGLSGVRPALPRVGRLAAQIVIGVAIGHYLTRDLVATMGEILPFTIAAALISILFSCLVAAALMAFGGIDRPTAFFGAMPGGVVEMSVLAERFGGNASVVALVQAIRIAVVVIVVPPTIFFVAPPVAATAAAPLGEGLRLVEIALVIGGGVALSQLIALTGFTNHALIGGLAAGGIATYFSLTTASVPVPLLDFAQILVGCTLGGRLDRRAAVGLGRLVVLVVVGLFAFLAVTLALALAISAATGIDLFTMVLATIPGGVAEASITAKALHLGVGEVAAFHLVRIVIVLGFCSLLFRLIERLRPLPAPDAGEGS